MKTTAKVAYLTALIGQSQQREQRHETALASADTPHDQVSATARLRNEQARQRELQTERAGLTALLAGPAGVLTVNAAA